MEENTVTVHVTDWSKYNPRTDSKLHSWIRFENQFFEKTFSWTNDERMVFIYVLCKRSQSKQDVFDIDMGLASVLLKLPFQKIMNDLTSLNNSGFIELKSNLKLLKVTQSNFESPCTTIRNETKRDETQKGSTCEKTYKSRRLRGAISEFQEHVTIEDMLSSVTHNLQTTWISVYGDVAWLRQEVLKAVAWEAANPRKISKDKGRFLTNWFSRGWESHRKTQPAGGKKGVEIWAEEQARKEQEEKNET